MKRFHATTARKACVAAVTVGILAVSCRDGAAPDTRPRARFEGRFLLQSINGDPLPVPIPWSQNRTFEVKFGEAFLPIGDLNFGLTGEVDGIPSIILFVEPAYGSLTASDSFYLDNGMRGRVWGDTLELQTTPVYYGDHRWRFLRPATP
jgi:hypothetical protein